MSVDRTVSGESTGSEYSTDGCSDTSSAHLSPDGPQPDSGDGSQCSVKTNSLPPEELELLAKLEEANRQLQISPDPLAPKDPVELELLVKLQAANRLLEADNKACKALTPSHSRTGSNADPAGSQGPGHSRKGSSTSMISNNSTTSNVNEEESSHSNLWEIWGKIVNDWTSAKKKPAFIKQLVRRGIPHPFRGLAWQLLLDVNTSPMKDMYVEYLKQKSPSEKMIRRDIARTFPEHDFFKEKNGLGQESLFNVMKAYSLHDREVGYCQGSGFIVGLLLMQMPEEEAFAVLVKLMQDYRLREIFKPSMTELGLCMYKLECLIQELMPDLYTHFQSQSFHTSMYASPWFLTLFATNVPHNVACRVLDLFISEGMDVIFRIGIAILQSSHSDLLSLDMEGMLQYFQKEVPLKFEQDEEAIFSAAYNVRFSAKKLKRLEKEYTALKSKENEDQIELRRLRTENRLLRQRIDNLEKESASLADRLIQYQLTRAQEAEETYALKNELSLTRQKCSKVQKQLQESESLLEDIKERTDSIHSASTLDEAEASQVIQNLQEELIMVRLREADNCLLVKNLRTKISELEQMNTQLQQAPSNDVQCLQEELIAVKLREAEANLSLKEMRQTISDLESNWQRHLSQSDFQSSPRDKSSKGELKAELKKAQEDLMSSKIREAAALSHLKDTKQKVMELETSNQICSNQIRRMDEENKKVKGDLDDAGKREAELQKQVKSLLRKMDDLESKRREEMMMARIREAENDQAIGELRQKLAEMEIRKEEVLAADALQNKGGKQELENRIFDLQEEVLQLKLSASPKSSTASTSSTSPRVTFNKMEEEEDLEDYDDIEDPETLNRTLSEIIDGKRSSTSLIAILNRENSDCESIKSSGSENSSSGQKTQNKSVFSNLESMGLLKVVDSLKQNGGKVNCDTSKHSAIDESGGVDWLSEGQSDVTCSKVQSGSDSSQCEKEGTQSSESLYTVTNGEIVEKKEGDGLDSNENDVHIEKVQNLSEQHRNVKTETT